MCFTLKVIDPSFLLFCLHKALPDKLLLRKIRTYPGEVFKLLMENFKSKY